MLFITLGVTRSGASSTPSVALAFMAQYLLATLSNVLDCLGHDEGFLLASWKSSGALESLVLQRTFPILKEV